MEISSTQLKHLATIDSVSYTHLDVYKRQEVSTTGGTGGKNSVGLSL